LTTRQRHVILADNVVVSGSDNDNDNVNDSVFFCCFVVALTKGVALWL
jgi:hypothetical protein